MGLPATAHRSWRSPPLRRLRNNLDLPVAYVRSAYTSRLDRHQFEGLTTYCMFLGYPRSGHSLVGSLIDAHPDAVIAHEADVLRYVQAHFSRSQVYSLILENARRHRDERAHVYDYTVPDQWQGRHRRLTVIGDKKGGRSTRRLADAPTLVERLQRTVGVPIRFIHVTRNPFDNIATISTRTLHDRGLGSAVAEYLALCATVDRLRDRLGPAVLDVAHESLLARPQEVLGEICTFVGLDPEAPYLDACAGILFGTPRRTRHDVTWTQALVDQVEAAIARYQVLGHYSWDD